MADAMIGFGIGLSGTPKDYTSIVAARQRQKQLGELEEKKKKQAMNEDILKSISVPSGLVMDYRMKEMEQATGDFVREAQDAIEKQDINSLAQLKQQYKMLWDQRVAERKVFDDDIKNYEAGKTVLATDPRLLMQAKTPEDALKLAQEYPDSFYSSDSGNITLRPTGTLNFQDVYLKNQKESDGKWVRQGNKDIWEADPDDYNNRNSATFDSRLDVRNNAKAIYINRYGYQTLNTLSPQDQYDELKRFFIENGKPFLPGQKMKFEPRGNVTNVNVGGGDQTQGIGDITKNNITVSRNLEGGGKADFPVSNVDSYTTRKWSSVAAKATDARDYRTGYPLKTGVKDYTFGEISVLPVYKQDYVGLLGRVKDQIVGDKELERDKKAGRVVYKVFAIGTANQNKRIVDVYVPANQVIGGLSGVLNDEQKVKQDENYREMQRLADEYNNAMGQPSAPASTTRTAAPTQRTSTPAPKAGGTEPATGGTSKWFSGEYNAKGVK